MCALSVFFKDLLCFILCFSFVNIIQFYFDRLLIKTARTAHNIDTRKTPNFKKAARAGRQEEARAARAGRQEEARVVEWVGLCRVLPP